MTLFENIQAANTLKEKANIVWKHYESRKLNSDLEPKWIHAAYEAVNKFVEGTASDEEKQLAKEVVMSHSMKDGHSVPAFPEMPSSPMRIIHDGWKSGTPTWVFMGRGISPDSIQDIGEGWVAVKRTLPLEFYKDIDPTAPQTLWIAYHRDQQMGTSALTSNCVGPACSLDDLLNACFSAK